MSKTVPVKRKSPRKRCETPPEDDGTSEELESESSSDEEIVSDEESSTEQFTMVDIKQMEEQIEAMKQKITELEKENKSLKFNLDNIAYTDKKVSFYTGFPSRAALMSCFKFLGPAVNELIYWNSKVDDTASEVKKKGRPRSLAPIDEFFLVLVRLQLGLLEQDLADRVGLSCATISRIFTTWINFLYLKLKEIPLWPPKDVAANMPKCFQDLYPTTRVIIDATEVYIEKPSLPDLQQMTFSNYKNSNTFKALVGISPSGAITFVSSLYSGSISDKELTRRSGILALLEKGDSVMADRGFDIETDLIPLGVN